MTDIRLDHIAKRYDNGFEAVKDLSLVFEAGSFTVLLGPSGCGKTTTLRMIAGLESISSGHLYFGEKEVTDVPPKDRDIGMVFQNYALYPHLTVFENIAFPLRLRKTPKKEVEERVRAAAVTVELEHLLERKPKQLSGGQRQRVALARAIVRKPRVFLFDEPLSNLDTQLRQQMRAEITRLQRMVGATAVYVTHDQSEAMTMADRIVILNKGELQQVGTPQEIYANPTNRFVAGFVGSPTINFFEGRLQRIGGHDSFCENGSSLAFSLEAANLPKAVHYGQKCTLAIRPEHLLLTQPMSNSPLYSFSATVERIEFLGHERLLYIQTAPQLPPHILRTNDMSSEIPLGVTMTFYAAPEHCYFFDEAGKRL